jgi:uncharacterized protein YggE
MIGTMSAAGVPSERVVVVGRAQRAVEADVANLVFTVVEVDSDQRGAFACCGERINALAPRLRTSAGVPATVSTGHLDVTRHYSDEDGREQPEQYAASCPLAVECAPEAAASVIAEAIAAGVDGVHGPRYGVRDPSSTIDELLGEAFRDARRKALRLSAAAERQLGDATAASGSAGGVDLQPARHELTATVRVTFALASA